MSSWLVVAAVAIGCVVLAFVTLSFLVRAPVYLVIPALEAGRYEQALARMQYLRWAPGARVLEGALLFHLDRLSDAEALLRRAEAETGQGAVTRAWVHIGQGRYEDAVAALPRSVVRVGNLDVTPTPWAPLESITELLTGRANADTLRRLDSFYAWKRDDLHSHEAGWESELLAVRSWARQALGEADGAAADRVEAVRALPPGNPSAAGLLYFLLAMAAEDGGATADAGTFWGQAATADPDGVWGRIARESQADSSLE
jgi:tetratricopeptide (TPR) repeat protein